MKFYNINSQGKIWAQRGNFLPVVNIPEDEGRIFYQKSDKQLYFYDSISWNGVSSGYADIPLGTKTLFESDTVVLGYTLLTSLDDMVVYITKGTGAGGESGGTSKSGSTWSQPNHNHDVSSSGIHAHSGPNHDHNVSSSGTHAHSGPSHTHIGGSHALTIAQMPLHTHAGGTTDSNGIHTHSLTLYSNTFQNPVASQWGENEDGDATRITSSSGAHTHTFTTTSAGSNSAHGHGSTTTGGTGQTGNNGNHDHGGATGSGGTGQTGNDGNHDHGGATGSNATASSWRPTGYNYTRQQRI